MPEARAEPILIEVTGLCKQSRQTYWLVRLELDLKLSGRPVPNLHLRGLLFLDKL